MEKLTPTKNDHRSPPGLLRRELTRRYQEALKAELHDVKGDKRGSRARLLGRSAHASGFRVVDMAKVHEHAMVSLALAPGRTAIRKALLRRAGSFLAEVLQPWTNAQVRVRRQMQDLERRARVLAVGNRKLENEVKRRKAGEMAVLKSKEEYRTLLLQSQTMERKLRHLTHQIIRAQEEERKEISREIHDEVAQTLAGFSVELATLSKGASVSIRVLKQKISRTRRIVEGSVKVLHRFARDLRPPALEELGLIPALHAYNASFAARKKINIRLSASRVVEELDSAKRTVLYRVAQEALTNVARHARATTVHMSITEIPGAIRMAIRDDGQAFDVEKILGARNPKRLGLIGMRERVEMVGGRFSLASRAGEGTTVQADVPFVRASKS